LKKEAERTVLHLLLYVLNSIHYTI